MKKIIFLFMFLLIFLVGCTDLNQNIDNNDTEETVKYYNDDESINLFINKYNSMYDPDITGDMITKKHIGGSDRNDVVTISNDKLEIIIYGGIKHSDVYSMSVYIGYKPEIKADNSDFYKQFVKYVKLFDNSLSTESIEKYWKDMISEYRSSYEINEIDIWPNIIDGKVEYFKIESDIKL